MHDHFQRRLLTFVELQGRRTHDFVEALGFRIATHFFGLDAHEAGFFQGLQCGIRTLAELGHRHAVFWRVIQNAKDHMLPRRSAREFFHRLGIGLFCEHRDSSGLGGIFLRPHRLGQQRADHRLDATAIIPRDPLAHAQQSGRHQRLGIDQGLDLTQAEVRLSRLDHRQHRARGMLSPQRHPHPTPRAHGHPSRHGVVKHQLRRAIDQHADIHRPTMPGPPISAKTQFSRPRKLNVQMNNFFLAWPKCMCFSEYESQFMRL